MAECENLRRLADEAWEDGGPDCDCDYTCTMSRALPAALDAYEAMCDLHEFLCGPVPQGRIERMAYDLRERKIRERADAAAAKLAALDKEAGQ